MSFQENTTQRGAHCLEPPNDRALLQGQGSPTRGTTDGLDFLTDLPVLSNSRTLKSVSSKRTELASGLALCRGLNLEPQSKTVRGPVHTRGCSHWLPWPPCPLCVRGTVLVQPSASDKQAGLCSAPHFHLPYALWCGEEKPNLNLNLYPLLISKEANCCFGGWEGPSLCVIPFLAHL